MKKYLRKPNINKDLIQAVQLLNTDESIIECVEFVYGIGTETSEIGRKATVNTVRNGDGFIINISNCYLVVLFNDYIIKDLNGQFHVLRPNEFYDKYEEINYDKV